MVDMPAQCRLPVKVVVFNNGALHFIELEQKSSRFSLYKAVIDDRMDGIVISLALIQDETEATLADIQRWRGCWENVSACQFATISSFRPTNVLPA